MKKKVNDERLRKLLPLIQVGDAEAFEQLYDLYKVQVFNFCYSILKSKSDTEEIVQDVFLQIWRSRDQVGEINSFNAFIYRIAKNKTLNKIRKRVGEPESFEEIEDNISILNQTENDVLFNEMQEILDTAITALPPKRQEIFRLSREKGLSNEEIAQQLNISVNTVKSQMTKALASIDAYIKCVSVYIAAVFFS